MKLPWVSRLAYELVVEERDHLRAENQKLTDDLTRIHRREAGLPEEKPKPKKERKPMPKRIHDYIEGFWNESQRREMRRSYYRRHAKGESWESIAAEVVPEETGDSHG